MSRLTSYFAMAAGAWMSGADADRPYGTPAKRKTKRPSASTKRKRKIIKKSRRKNRH